MAIAIAANVTGTVGQGDRRAMDAQIAAENARRAALETPGTPLANSTAAERKTSYEAILNARLAEVHASYVSQANSDLADVRTIRQALPTLPDAKIASILAIVNQ